MLSLVRSLAYRLRTRPALGRLALRLIPDIPWTLNLEGIGPFRVRLRRNRSLWLRQPLDAEDFPFAMLRTLVRPGDVVYDAGANLGLYARHLVNTLQAGRVIAFEPVAENRALLAENLALGGIAGRVTVFPVALSDEDGTVEFQLDDMQSASGSLSKVTGGEPSMGRKNLGLQPLTTQVPSRRLDTLVREENLPLPDVLKLDVEGAEALVLGGAAGILESRGPRLLIEFHGAPMVHAALPLLAAHGYTCVAKVAAHIAPGCFAPVDPSLLPRIQGLYDVHFIAASRDPRDLPESWQERAPS